MGGGGVWRVLRFFVVSNVAFWGVSYVYMDVVRPPYNAAALRDCTFAPDDRGYIFSLDLSVEQCNLISYRYGFLNWVLDYRSLVLSGGKRLHSEAEILVKLNSTDYEISKGSVDIHRSDLLWGSTTNALYDERGYGVQSFVGGDGQRVYVRWGNGVRHAQRLFRGSIQISYFYESDLDEPFAVDGALLTFLDKTIIR